MINYSVAICTYNGELYILEQLQSIVDQTVPPIEIVVFDDCSSDTTFEIVISFAQKHPNIKWIIEINNVNLGYKGNFYKAINRCTSEFIFLSDQDDVWVLNKAEKILSKFTNNKSIDVIFTNAFVTNERLIPHNKSLFQYVNFYSKQDFYSFKKNSSTILLSRSVATGATMVVKKSFLQYLGNFSDKAYFEHDAWIASVAACLNKLSFMEDKLIYYRQHNNNQIGINNFKTQNSIANTTGEYLVALLINSIKRENEISNFLIKNFSSIDEVNYLKKRNKLFGNFLKMKGRRQQLYLLNPNFYILKINNFHNLRMYLGNSLRILLNR